MNSPMRPVSTLLVSLALALALALVLVVPYLAAQIPAAEDRAGDSPGMLRPGDLVRLKIWREPDLSGDFQVQESGEVVFPKIGLVQVTALSSGALKQKLLDSYSVYLQNPSIEITVLRRVQVLGAVRNPGLYPVDPTMAVADVLALAGGTTPQGNPKKIELKRGGERITASLSGGTRLADTPLRSGDQLFVPERGWMSRNPWIVAAAISGTTTVLIALLRR
jgi:protein involved in polysaccharide export with SLBB domain